MLIKTTLSGGQMMCPDPSLDLLSAVGQVVYLLVTFLELSGNTLHFLIACKLVKIYF